MDKIPQMPQKEKVSNFFKIFPVIFVFLILLFLLANPFVIIPSGYVGVKLTLGKADKEELHPGLNIVIPIVQKVVKMSVRTHSYDLRGANSINSLSKDGLTINTELTVLYKIMSDKAAEIYIEYGLEYEDKIIKPVIRSAVRDVIAKLDSSQVYQERDVIQKKLMEKVSKELEKRYILLDEILIRDIKLPKRVVEAIEQKRRAYEEAEKMKFLVEKEKLEAERKRVEAKGIADANKIIAGSLTKEYLQWKFIENIKSYAEGDNNTVILIPYDTEMTPIINLPNTRK
ncbi:MAG TPA: prohibitin family protein [Persephonella sp.]|uniref:Putative band 7 protein n=1 Tax=Persephonella marina (strain DSM 14350 / EX-H1) TaxID=123214 RepID=C0QPG5_PERMH|nr:MULTISPECIES: prohibitin family protein [Persephonella]ACO03526.1 putative band 7 protein [Persephonella marina EX-H1]HCB69824.1 prohibitin family protein [Persephonella sp.]